MKAQREILAQIPEFTPARGQYSQYLRDDLTQKQRQKHALLVAERNNRNQRDGYSKSDAKRWKIFNWEVVLYQPNQGNRY